MHALIGSRSMRVLAWFCALAMGVCIVGSASRVEAQAELDGTFIDYLGVGANGIMLNAADRSMRYREGSSGSYSCDVWFPGRPVYEFGVEATGTTNFTAFNTPFGTDIATTSGPTVDDRTISWTGRYESGAQAITVNQQYAFTAVQRHVILTVRLTNSGTVPLNDVYFIVNGDPDHGCLRPETTNDVVSQPPGSTSAMVVARGNRPDVTLALGAYDSRARANAGGFEMPDPSATWNAPTDPGGTTEDVAISLVLKENALAVGASATFRIAYVWGTSTAAIQTRFLDLQCRLQGLNSACTDDAGVPGTCRASRCCTGCWDGNDCLAGTATTTCGIGGALCESCNDNDACTDDLCSTGLCQQTFNRDPCNDNQFCTVSDRCDGAGNCLGAARDCSDSLGCTDDSCDEGSDSCEHPVNTGCEIDDACVPDGTVNPENSCERCDSAESTTEWTASVGMACDDGAFCTVDDACNAGGECTGETRNCADGLSCTGDTCSEAANECVSAVTDGCLIDGACVAEGTPNPENQCEVCDGSESTTDWSPASSGTTCDDGAFCTDVDACNGSGECVGQERACSDDLDCTADSCDEDENECVNSLSSGCLIDGACVDAGGTNPASSCQVCEPAATTTAWTFLDAGTECDDGMYCTVTDACDAAGACLGTARDCTDKVDCTTDMCDETADECVHPVPEGCLIDGECVAEEARNPENDCEWCQNAVSSSDWSNREAESRCGDPSCEDGVLTPAATCDGEGTCEPGEPMNCEGAICADEISCTGTCKSDLECLETHYCVDGECIPDLDDGSDCERDEMCERGFCVDGVCCIGRCAGACRACNVSGNEGECTPYADGTDPEDECAGDATCSGEGMCVEITPDGGSEDGGMIDEDGGTDEQDGGGGVVDAGDEEITDDDGCGCRVPGASSGRSPTGALLLAGALIALLGIRRGRRKNRR